MLAQMMGATAALTEQPELMRIIGAGARGCMGGVNVGAVADAHEMRKKRGRGKGGGGP